MASLPGYPGMERWRGIFALVTGTSAGSFLQKYEKLVVI